MAPKKQRIRIAPHNPGDDFNPDASHVGVALFQIATENGEVSHLRHLASA